MDRVVKVATPLTAPTVVVPLSMLPPGLVARVTVTFDVSLPTRLPNKSRTRTVTAGLRAWPAIALLGDWLKPRWWAAVGVTVTAFAAVEPRAASVTDSTWEPAVL